MFRILGTTVCLTFLVLSSGCAHSRRTIRPIDTMSLEDRALECLKRGIQYKPNAVVRTEAIEALRSYGSADSLPWIRTALMDEHPAVRFAACMAIGEMEDAKSQAMLLKCATDKDVSVRVAALFALHRIGTTERTGLLVGHLLDDEDPTVRRNAALALGLMKEPGAIKILARAMKDEDIGVRNHALEAMGRLGNPESRQQLVFLANSGVGSEEVFAINALAELQEKIYYDIFLYKLDSASHLETKLAAARGLGLLGMTEGFAVALDAIDFNRPVPRDNLDTPADQILRTRQLAAAALGAIGEPAALPELNKSMISNEDARLQVSAAKAILEILAHDHTGDVLFATPAGQAGSQAKVR